MAEKCILQPRDLFILSLQDDSGYFARVRIIKLDLSFLLRYLRSKCTAWMMLAQALDLRKRSRSLHFQYCLDLAPVLGKATAQGHNLNLSSNTLQDVEILASLLDLFIATVFLLQAKHPQIQSESWMSLPYLALFSYYVLSESFVTPTDCSQPGFLCLWDFPSKNH